MCVNKVDNIVNKHTNSYHSTIKMKPIDVKASAYINVKYSAKYSR